MLWKYLHQKGMHYTWMCKGNRSLCCSWTCLQHTSPELHLDVTIGMCYTWSVYHIEAIAVHGLAWKTWACDAPGRVYTTGAWASPGRIWTTGAFAASGRVYTTYRSLCCSWTYSICTTEACSDLYVPTSQGPELHLGCVWTTGACVQVWRISILGSWATPGQWACLHYRCLCSNWTCPHLVGGLSCTCTWIFHLAMWVARVHGVWKLLLFIVLKWKKRIFFHEYFTYIISIR